MHTHGWGGGGGGGGGGGCVAWDFLVLEGITIETYVDWPHGGKVISSPARAAYN